MQKRFAGKTAVITGGRQVSGSRSLGALFRKAARFLPMISMRSVWRHWRRNWVSSALRCGPFTVLCRSSGPILCSKGDEPWAQAGRMNLVRIRFEWC